MKVNPLLLAVTFLLGCLVTLIAIDTIRGPVYAAGQGASGSSSIVDFAALTVQVEAGKEVVVVFKDIENWYDKRDPKLQNPLSKITSMAVYEIEASGQGFEITLSGTRFIDYDMYYYEFTTGGKKISVPDARKEYLKNMALIKKTDTPENEHKTGTATDETAKTPTDQPKK